MSRMKVVHRKLDDQMIQWCQEKENLSRELDSSKTEVNKEKDNIRQLIQQQLDKASTHEAEMSQCIAGLEEMNFEISEE